MIFAPLADSLFASANSGQVSPVAQLAEEGDETPWYNEFSRPAPSTSDGRHKVERTSLLCKVDMLSTGVEDTLPHYTVQEFAAGFKKTLAFQTCAKKQDGGSSGKGIDLDHQAESWQPLHVTPREGVHGREGHAVQGEGICIIRRKAGNYCTSLVVKVFVGEDDTLSRVATLSIGVEDVLPHYTAEEFAAGFKKALAFQSSA
ncbi:unnamed protein product [Symbiodinium sp. CCMP2456]|nr:unnamed protein product [Symbiodinium sp. CCMP2456]